jgi:hypothetical protein
MRYIDEPGRRHRSLARLLGFLIEGCDELATDSGRICYIVLAQINSIVPIRDDSDVSKYADRLLITYRLLIFAASRQHHQFFSVFIILVLSGLFFNLYV